MGKRHHLHSAVAGKVRLFKHHHRWLQPQDCRLQAVHPTLHSQGAIDALLMAEKDVKRKSNLIHHSDRGTQYCCAGHVRIIEHLGIQLSMTEKGDPYENAVAERVNGILKNELSLGETFSSFEQAKEAVEQAVRKYNTLRPHDSCDRLTPVMAHEQTGLLKKHWKPKVYKKRAVAEPAP